MNRESILGIIKFVGMVVLLAGLGGLLFILIAVYVVDIGDGQVVVPDIIWDVLLGGVINVVGLYFFIFVLLILLKDLGSALMYTFETWIGFLAPVTGGAVGAAVSGGGFDSWVFIPIVGLIVGGIGLPIVGVITEKKGLKGIGPDLIAGLFFGALNGFVLSGILKLLALIGVQL